MSNDVAQWLKITKDQMSDFGVRYPFYIWKESLTLWF